MLFLLQDCFVIGGCYIVCGFDGESLFSGECGWLLCNDFLFGIGGGQEFYVVVDYGCIGGLFVQWQFGYDLVGMVLGLCGGWQQFFWDGFVGLVLYKFVYFFIDYIIFGFSLVWCY